MAPILFCCRSSRPPLLCSRSHQETVIRTTYIILSRVVLRLEPAQGEFITFKSDYNINAVWRFCVYLTRYFGYRLHKFLAARISSECKALSYTCRHAIRPRKWRRCAMPFPILTGKFLAIMISPIFFIAANLPSTHNEAFPVSWSYEAPTKFQCKGVTLLLLRENHFEDFS